MLNMKSKAKIIVVGIGGVGGYLGGKLASCYENPDVKIFFITRRGNEMALASLTGKVVELGKKQHVFIPFYEKAFAHLIKS